MQTILMPIDFSDATDPAVEFVAGIAPAMGAAICVLHVSEADLDDPEQGRSAMQPKLDAVADQLKAKRCEVITKLVFGSPIKSILDQVDVLGPSVVVMGSHGHSALHDLLMGSVTHRVLRSGKCPLLIVPSPRPELDVPQGIDTSDLADLYGFPEM